MDNLNVLFVSIAFPPKSDPECLQTAKYFKYLAKDKSLNIDVVTAHDKALFMPVDKGLEKYAKGYRQIIKVPFFENKYVNFLMRKINKDSLNYPDSKFRFAKKYQWVLKELKNPPDIIYSRSFPISSTIMAYNLKKELQVPWVLHLSDPWTFGTLQELGSATNWNIEMESKCFKEADALTFTSYKTIEEYKKKYPQFADKMHFFPNVYDEDDKSSTNYSLGEKIKIVYTGGLIKANKRDPEYFFKAVKLFQEQEPQMIKDFQFIFAGSLDRESKAVFKQYMDIIPQIEYLGELPFTEAIKLQGKADILLIIDIPLDSIFFPSKLLDYILAQKRVLAITKKDSCTYKNVNKDLGVCYEHNQTQDIANEFKYIHKQWQNKNIDFFKKDNSAKEFSADYNAKKLATLFKDICGVVYGE